MFNTKYFVLCLLCFHDIFRAFLCTQFGVMESTQQPDRVPFLKQNMPMNILFFLFVCFNLESLPVRLRELPYNHNFFFAFLAFASNRLAVRYSYSEVNGLFLFVKFQDAHWLDSTDSGNCHWMKSSSLFLWPSPVKCNAYPSYVSMHTAPKGQMTEHREGRRLHSSANERLISAVHIRWVRVLTNNAGRTLISLTGHHVLFCFFVSVYSWAKH